jgi:hypothetical protein
MLQTQRKNQFPADVNFNEIFLPKYIFSFSCPDEEDKSV